jgi:hypothetical protein
MADESAATQAVAASFNVVEVPTFVFMRSGREVARHVGSSRGDLIGRILQVSASCARCVRMACRPPAPVSSPRRTCCACCRTPRSPPQLQAEHGVAPPPPPQPQGAVPRRRGVRSR